MAYWGKTKNMMLYTDYLANGTGGKNDMSIIEANLRGQGSLPLLYDWSGHPTRGGFSGGHGP